MSPWLTRVRLFSSPGSYSFECSRPRGHGEPKCLLPKRITETDEELYSGNECLLRAKALLTHLKDPVDYMTIKSTVIDYGNTPFCQRQSPRNASNRERKRYYRIISVEHRVDAKTKLLK